MEQHLLLVFWVHFESTVVTSQEAGSWACCLPSGCLCINHFLESLQPGFDAS